MLGILFLVSMSSSRSEMKSRSNNSMMRNETALNPRLASHARSGLGVQCLKHGGPAMFRTLILLTFVFSLALALSAQSGGRGQQPPGTGSVPNKPAASNPNLTSPDMTPRSFFLSGQVRVDDGTLLTDAAAIQSICSGRIRTEGYTDSKGHFSFEVSNL